MKIKNKWRFASICLCIIILFLIFYNQPMSYSYEDKYYHINDDFKVEKSAVDSFTQSNNNEPFQVCQLKTGKCVSFVPLN